MHARPFSNFRQGFHLVTAAIVLIIVNLLWLIPVTRNIRYQVSLLRLEIADRVAADVRNYFTGVVAALEIAAEDIRFLTGDRRVILAKLLKHNRGIDAVALIDGAGQSILEEDRFNIRDVFAGKNYAADPLFYRTLEGVPRFGDIFISRQLEPHTAIAVPVKTATGELMVLMAEINLRELIPFVSDISIREGIIYVLDRNGVQILHPELSEILQGRHFSGRPITKRVLSDGTTADGLSAIDSYVNERGFGVFAVGRPVGIGGLGVFVEQPRSIALATERQMTALAIFIVLAGLVAYYFILKNQMRLNALLYELDEIGKILVRRDLELSRANTQLMEFDAVKSEFVSIAAHQLRTPLTGIKWSLNALRANDAEPLAPQQSQIVQAAYEATNRMVDLIGDLLNVARIEEKRFSYRLTPTALEPMLGDLIVQYKGIAEGRRLIFVADVTPVLPQVCFDGEKMKIALDNLLANAVDYTPVGGTVTLRVSVDGDNVSISVQDTGIGIPKEQRHRVFSKFFRASNAQLKNTSGTGLGLYMAEQIVVQHGGTLKFFSEEGKGSIFTIRLPKVA